MGLSQLVGNQTPQDCISRVSSPRASSAAFPITLLPEHRKRLRGQGGLWPCFPSKLPLSQAKLLPLESLLISGEISPSFDFSFGVPTALLFGLSRALPSGICQVTALLPSPLATSDGQSVPSHHLCQNQLFSILNFQRKAVFFSLKSQAKIVYSFDSLLSRFQPEVGPFAPSRSNQSACRGCGFPKAWPGPRAELVFSYAARLSVTESCFLSTRKEQQENSCSSSNKREIACKGALGLSMAYIE